MNPEYVVIEGTMFCIAANQLQDLIGHLHVTQPDFKMDALEGLLQNIQKIQEYAQDERLPETYICISTRREVEMK